MKKQSKTKIDLNNKLEYSYYKVNETLILFKVYYLT